MAKHAFVALGANLGDSRATLARAIESIDALATTRVLARSVLYRTSPVGFGIQPDFVNAVVELATDLSPEDLLRSLHEIELQHGRVRSFANAPRTLDLDLLLYGDEVHSTPTLVLPHPRMHERAFVLVPLLEIAPLIEIPGRGRARDFLAQCSDQRVTRLDA